MFKIGDLVRIKDGFVDKQDCPIDRRIGLLVDYDKESELWVILLNGKNLKFNEEWIDTVKSSNDN